jgi:mRNA-degrading endonuclease toxin of MazEF toxin-antitoxin module
MSMPSYLKGSVVLIRYPFSDLTNAKVRPAVVVSASHPSEDMLIVPLTSKTERLLPGEFVMRDWKAAGLNVASAIKRGVFTIHQSLVIRRVGELVPIDAKELESSLRLWFGL